MNKPSTAACFLLLSYLAGLLAAQLPDSPTGRAGIARQLREWIESVTD